MNELRVLTLIFLIINRCRFHKERSIADTIRKRYGPRIVRYMRRLEKVDFKVRKKKLDITFLEACITNKIIPTFLKFKTANRRLRNTTAYSVCQNRLLLAEIEIKKAQLSTLEGVINEIKNNLKNKISSFDLVYLIHLFTPFPHFRPILSAIGTCTYNIAKFFAPILAEFSKNDYTVKDSFSFAE